MENSSVSKKRKWDSKTVVIAAVIVSMLALGGIIAGIKVFTVRPYAVSIDGDAVCYVKGSDEAGKVMSSLADNLIPDNTELKLVKADNGVTIDRAGWVTVDDTQVMTAAQAADIIEKSLSKTGDKVSITTVSTGTEEHSFTPEVKYEKDETMLAGESEVIERGKKGKEQLLVSYTCINGEVIGRDILDRKVENEGKSKVVKKGILGLPEGADWET